jgi:hypothetical protein
MVNDGYHLEFQDPKVSFSHWLVDEHREV